MSKSNVTYWNYLQIEKLLNLQEGLGDNDEELSEDELHFIIVHQVFELWFKQIIRELSLIRKKMDVPYLNENQVPFIVHHLNRVNSIIKISADHYKVMETLTPQDFLLFRAKLGTASGFQSFQMREIELAMGLQQSQRDMYGHGNPVDYIMKTADNSEFGNYIRERLNQYKNLKSIRECLNDWLYRTPIHGSTPSSENDENVVTNFIEEYMSVIRAQNEKQLNALIAVGNDPDKIKAGFKQSYDQIIDFLNATDVEKEDQIKLKRIRASILFIESYRELPLVAWPRTLIDTIVEMEEAFTTLRFNHARMVERIIGRRVGTGGSSGVDYLDQTTKYRIFPELWTVRTILLPKGLIPELKNKELYEFAAET